MIGQQSSWQLALAVCLLAMQTSRPASADLLGESAGRGVKLGKVEHPYNSINKELCKALKTDDYEENAKLIVSKFKEENRSPIKLTRKGRLRLLALELLGELERLRATGSWCKSDQYDQLARKNKGEVMQHVAALRERQPTGLLMCNRVFELFFMQTLNHLESCSLSYKDDLLQTYQQLNEFRLRDADRALEPLISTLEQHLGGSSGEFEFVATLRRQLQSGQLDGQLIEHAASSVAQLVSFHNAQQMALEEVRDHTFGLLDGFMFQPATYLTSNLRPTLAPAGLDLENLDEFWQGGQQLSEVHKRMSSYGSEFNKIWTKYLLADRILELDLSKLADVLVKKALEKSLNDDDVSN